MNVREVFLTGVLFLLLVGPVTADDAEPAAAPVTPEATPAEPETTPTETVEPAAELEVPKTKEPEAAIVTGPTKATVISTQGAAEYRKGPGKPWQKVAVGQELFGNAEISTGLTGEVVLRLDTDAEVTVRRLTQVCITQLEKTDRVNVTELNVKYGTLKAKVKKGTLANDFKVKTARFSLSVTGTDIARVGFYRGFGGHTQMGGHGSTLMRGPNGLMPLGAGDGSDDQGTPPMKKRRKRQRTNTTMPGSTKWEKRGAQFRGLARWSPWELLRSGNPGGPGRRRLLPCRTGQTTPLVHVRPTSILNGNGDENGDRNGDENENGNEEYGLPTSIF